MDASSSNVEVLLERANIHSERHEWLGAIECFEQVIFQGKELTYEGYQSLGVAHIRCGNVEAAHRAVELGHGRHPGRPDFPRLRAEIQRTRRSIRELQGFGAELKGRHCVVFGSAPDPRFIDDRYREKIIVCCNGSALTLQTRFQLEPAFSLVQSHVLNRSNESDADVREALAQVSCLGKLVLLRGFEEECDVSSLRAKCTAAMGFHWGFRFAVVRRVLGFPPLHLDNSTGAFAVAVCAFLGATSIELVGISLERKGHSYNANNRYRNHVASDAILYGLLTLHGVPLISAEKSVAMICTNKIE